MGVHTRVSLGDILQGLGHDVKATLVSHFRRDKSLKAARLACRALREVVDSSLQEVRITLVPADEGESLWRHGVPPPLHRWGNCTAVKVLVSSFAAQQPAGSLLLLPFVGLPLKNRQRITSLALSWPESVPGTVLSTLLQRLPSLQKVILSGDTAVDPIQARILGEALASLPHLEHLGLPDVGSLDCLRALADSSSLRRLVVDCSSNQLDSATASAIGRLQQLQHLNVPVNDADELLLLLGALPRSVQVLELPAYSLLGSCKVRLHMGSGIITGIKGLKGSCFPGQLAAFAAEALLPSSALGQHLERISMQEVWVRRSDTGFLEGPQLQPLRQLLRRCAQVQVGSLQLEPDTGLGLAEQALSLFGAYTEELRLKINKGSVNKLYARIQLRPAMRLAAAGMAGALHGGLAFAAGSPGLVDLAFELLTSAGAAGNDVIAGDSGDPGPGYHNVLLLRRRLPPGAAPLPGGGAAPATWLQRVAGQAVEAIALACGEEPCGCAEYLALPCGTLSSVGLLSCRTPAKLAVAAKAARVVADAMAAWAEDGDSPLEVAPMFVSHALKVHHMTILDAVAVALGKAAQPVMDGTGFSAGWSERQQLCWLLHHWAQLGVLKLQVF